LGPPLRLAFAAAGLLALTPAGAFAGAGLTDIIGVAGGLALIGYEVLVARRQAAVP
jgi:hypothetical protein